ncbi:transient receptor potential cation channel subfamily A member 1-like [Watersipora subatra]|uniref:transient receptor potential cation channel subfamily A member 1-like n=1 Tax=Watersipora subatra TaxID=2589382 RepID=UPI00355AE6EF
MSKVTVAEASANAVSGAEASAKASDAEALAEESDAEASAKASGAEASAEANDSEASARLKGEEKAAKSGNCKEIECLLSQKRLNINLISESGDAAIHIATTHGHLKVVELLLKHPKTDVNILSKEGNAAIHLAAKHRRKAILKVLLNHGAKMSLRDGKGNAALHLAARKAHKEIAEVLLSQPHCDVDIQSRSNSTPLHFAIKSGSYEMCQLLIHSGASVYKEDIGQQSALILAAVEKSEKILQLTLDRAKLEKSTFEDYLHQKDHEGSAAFHLAVANNRCEHVRRLLEAGADVNCVKNDSSTALHLAAMFGFVEIAELLVKNGADVHRENHCKQTPLHRTAEFESKCQVAELLLSMGVDINAVDAKNMSPLHYAVRKGRLEIIRFLISNDALVDLTDDLGRSILHHSVISNQLSCFELLIELLPQEAVRRIVGVKDVTEKTALHYCADKGKLEFLKRLLQLGASAADTDENDKTAMHMAAENGYSECISTLFHHSKSEINDDDAEGCTPMLLACLNGHYSSVKALLKHGGDVLARGHDEFNHTVLTAAACNGHLEIVDLLLEHGNDTEVSTKYQETAMHLACRGNYFQVVELLLQYSASVICRNHKDQTPLDVAIECRSQQAAAAIINSNKWQEAMDCVDEGGNNPLPRLIAFMPSIAKLVLDRCIQHEGSPEKEDFAVTYNFKYLDPSPLSHCCKDGKIWYAMDMVEHACHDLMFHELTRMNMAHKWEVFGRITFVADIFCYLVILVIQSIFIKEMPNYISDYEDNQGFPMMVTVEERNNATLLAQLKQSGTFARFDTPTQWQVELVIFLKVTTLLLSIGSTIRLMVSLITLRWAILKRLDQYLTIGMLVCLDLAIWNIDEKTLVLHNYQWRLSWIGVLLTWASATHFLLRIPMLGDYTAMLIKVLKSVLQTLLVMILFLTAFAWCFSVTQHRAPEFTSPYLGLLSTMNMALGELSFVDRFVIGNTGPFYIDNLVLIGLFMVIVPIALMNLMIGIAVGDIASVKSKSAMLLIARRIDMMDMCQRQAMKFMLKRWYADGITIYPNRKQTNLIARISASFKLATRKAVYEKSSGWDNDSIATDTVKLLQENLELANTKIKNIESVLKQQNELLMSVACKAGAT